MGRQGFRLSYQGEDKKALQRVELVVLVILLPLALYGLFRSHRSWRDYQQAEAFLKSGQYLVHHGKYEPAAEELRRAVTLYPELFAAWADLATCHHLRGEHQAELEVFQEALTHLPESADLHYGLLGTYHELGQYQSQLEHLTVMRGLFPDQVVLLDRLAKEVRAAEAGAGSKEEAPKQPPAEQKSDPKEVAPE